MSRLCRQQHCGQRNQAVFPEYLKAPVQMGNSIDALAGYLKVGHHASHDKIAVFFRDILGIPFSHGGVQAALKRLSARLKPEYQGLIELCRNQPFLHQMKPPVVSVPNRPISGSLSPNPSVCLLVTKPEVFRSS